ncbi:hypothetical protein CDAR_35561 [Caerostris darwini]|uniref:Uncharacterized protein n=1 Tax=Caerostris darwini TaxID=1538125 RepID=A0AAV4SPB7_9ARAC|nr:hypothetical protein CDAR_35561 [Caerostris darwini]
MQQAKNAGAPLTLNTDLVAGPESYGTAPAAKTNIYQTCLHYQPNKITNASIINSNTVYHGETISFQVLRRSLDCVKRISSSAEQSKEGREKSTETNFRNRASVQINPPSPPTETRAITMAFLMNKMNGKLQKRRIAFNS